MTPLSDHNFKFTLLHLSDLHFGTETPSLCAALSQWAKHYAATLKQDSFGLVISGDLTQRATLAQMAASKQFVDSLGWPVLGHVAGNHDVPLWRFWERALSPLGVYRKVWQPPLRPSHWLSKDNLASIAFMQSARRMSLRPAGFWKDGKLRKADLAALQHTPTSSWKLLVTHHPAAVPRNFSQGDVVGNWAYASSKIANHGIHLILGGHLHEPYLAKLDLSSGASHRQALYVAAGTAVSNRTRHSPNSFNVIHFLSTDQLLIERWDYQPASPSPQQQGTFSRVAVCSVTQDGTRLNLQPIGKIPSGWIVDQ